MQDLDLFILEDVTIVNESGSSRLCEVEGRRFWIPVAQILPGSEVHRVGDRGRLVLARMSWIDAAERAAAMGDRLRGPSSPPRRESDDVLVVDDAEVISEGRRATLCKRGTHRFWVPNARILPGSEIRNNGDRGRLVVERWLAVHLGL